MAGQPLSIIVLSTDLDNFNEIHAALSTDNRVKLLAGGSEMDQIGEEVIRHKPSAVVISLGCNSDRAIRLIEHLKEKCPATAIISAARETSADLILQSLRAGAREFLRLPIRPDELKMVLDRTSEFYAGQVKAARNPGQITAVYSGKGGCGTSFVSVNLAAALTAKTVLVDLNLETGELPLFLNLNPKYSIADLVGRHGQLDDRLVAAFVTRHSNNLDLLAAPKEIDPIEKIRPEYVFEVLQKLRESYDHIVLDPPHTLDAITLTALDQADTIVLVLTLDILSIRSAQRTLKVFDRVGYPRTKLRVVVNRWSRQVDLDLPEVEKTLGEPVIGSIPSDYQTVVNSINLGAPLVDSNSNSKIAREIARVAKSLSSGNDVASGQKNKRSWSFFLKRPSAVAK
jgi:pilus assembly protein CpaE